MRIVTDYSQLHVTEQPPQAPLTVSATAEALLVHKDQFPLVDQFELVILGSGRAAGMPLGHEITVFLVNGASNQFVGTWHMYDFDVSGAQAHLPLPGSGEAVRALDEGEAFVAAADDGFVYIACGDDGRADPSTFTRYAKIHRQAYKAEWQAFTGWYEQALKSS